MGRLLRWYGASPLHLLAMLACFGLAGYAAIQLISFNALGVVVWFLGAVIGHDLLLMPLYSLADRSAMAALKHLEPPPPATGWINYVRVPAALSGLLLLVWFPLILRLRSPYHSSTALSADPYVWHWLAVTGVLFLLSAVAFALRLRRVSRTAASAERAQAPPAQAQAPAEQAAAGVLEDASSNGERERRPEPAVAADLESALPEEGQDARDDTPGADDADHDEREPASGPEPAGDIPDSGEIPAPGTIQAAPGPATPDAG